MFSHVYSCLPMYSRVYLGLLEFIYFPTVYSSLPMFTTVHSCLPMFTTLLVFIYIYYSLFKHVYPCLLDFIFVYTCLPMFTPFYVFTNVYSHLPMFTKCDPPCKKVALGALLNFSVQCKKVNLCVRCRKSVYCTKQLYRL